MGILGNLALWIIWLCIAAAILKFTIGGVIDCLKKGTRAPLISWVGAVIASIIALILVGIFG